MKVEITIVYDDIRKVYFRLLMQSTDRKVTNETEDWKPDTTLCECAGGIDTADISVARWSTYC